MRTWRTVGSSTDLHDFQLLANGDALLLTYPVRSGTIDLSPYGGPSQNATVIDAEIQEVAPDGTLVWSWNSKDHIPLSETGTRWWSVVPVTTLSDGRSAYDYAHINSIQQVGGTIVASFRHLDAVYAINKSSGDIIYKLGGTARPESLTVLDDPQSGLPLGGQHYARVLPDGTLTVHDNNTFLTPGPRVVRYRIDLFAKTAQLLEQVSDPDVASSFCCGSAQRLDDGSWLMSWGGTPIVTEFGPNGARHFELTFSGGISYRVGLVSGGARASPSCGPEWTRWPPSPPRRRFRAPRAQRTTACSTTMPDLASTPSRGSDRPTGIRRACAGPWGSGPPGPAAGAAAARWWRPAAVLAAWFALGTQAQAAPFVDVLNASVAGGRAACRSTTRSAAGSRRWLRPAWPPAMRRLPWR